MIETIKDKLSFLKIPKELIDKKIRKNAIEKAKERLMMNGLTPEEAGDNFEIIVKEEEDKIISDLKDKSIIGILIALGIETAMSM